MLIKLSHIDFSKHALIYANAVLFPGMQTDSIRFPRAGVKSVGNGSSCPVDWTGQPMDVQPKVPHVGAALWERLQLDCLTMKR